MKSESITIRVRPELKEALKAVFSGSISDSVEVMFMKYLNESILAFESDLAVMKNDHEIYMDGNENPIPGLVSMMEDNISSLETALNKHKQAMKSAFPDHHTILED